MLVSMDLCWVNDKQSKQQSWMIGLEICCLSTCRGIMERLSVCCPLLNLWCYIINLWPIGLMSATFIIRQGLPESCTEWTVSALLPLGVNLRPLVVGKHHPNLTLWKFLFTQIQHLLLTIYLMTSNVNINQECDKLNHVSFAMKPQKIKRQNVKKKKK